MSTAPFPVVEDDIIGGEVDDSFEDAIENLVDDVANVSIGDFVDNANQSADEPEDEDGDEDGDSDNLSEASTETYVSCRQSSVSDAAGATEEDLQNLESVVDYIDNCAVNLEFNQSQYDELVEFALRSDSDTKIQAHATLIAQRDRLYERVYENWEVSELLDHSIARCALALICCPKLVAYTSEIPHKILYVAVSSLGIEGGVPADLRLVLSLQQKLSKAIRRQWRKVRRYIKDAISESLQLNYFDRAMNILNLADNITRGSGMNPTYDLLVRIAYFRAQYVRNNDEDYWKRVDQDITVIYRNHRGDELGFIQEMELILEKDLNKYGSHEDSTHELAYYREQIPSSVEEDMNEYIGRYFN